MNAEAPFQIPDICNDCGFTDACPAEGVCVRAYLRTLGFDTGMPIEDAREIIAGAKQSAIVEPPTAAELRGIRLAPGATNNVEISDCTAIDVDHFAPPAGYKTNWASLQDKENGLIWISAPCLFKAEFSRAQIRAAIDEISKAQAQIAPGIGTGYSPDPEAVDAERTAVRVLEALPESVAAAFGLEIRAACAGCGTALFKDEPYMSDVRGRPVCETCNDGADPGALSERQGA